MNATDNIQIENTTPPADASPADGRGLTGKIARLPLALRRELQQRLLDGCPAGQVLFWLNSLPEVQAVLAAEFEGRPITKQNLSQWRGGEGPGLAQEQNQRADVKSLLAEIHELRGEAKDDLTEQLAFYLVVQLALEFQNLKAGPERPMKAKIWRELRASLVALRRGDLALGRLQLQREKYGLRHKTKEEREQEFWKWAEENINRDEFCRRRCFTAAEREAEIDKILGITPCEPPPEAPPATGMGQALDDSKPVQDSPK